MDRVSRPLIGLLVATVAVFALWVTMLKPSSPTGGANQGNIAKNPSLGQLTGAIAAAHGAVATANAASVQHGGVIGSTAGPAPAATTGGPVKPGTTTATATGASVRPSTQAPVHVHRVVHVRRGRVHVARSVVHLTAAGRLAVVTRALARHRVLALLFFNPAAADDRAVDRELATVPVHGGAVVKLAVPLSEVSNYATLTQQTPVSTSPTLLIIDRTRTATELIGFTDRFEIAQRVADAVAAR